MKTVPVFDLKATDLELLELLTEAATLLLHESPDPQEKIRLYGKFAFLKMKRALEEQHAHN